MQRMRGVAGEESGNALISPQLAAATSVPLVPRLEPSWERIASYRSPYDAATQWRPGPALAVVLLICAATAAIALGGSLLIVKRARDLTSIDGAAMVPMFLAQMTMIATALLAARRNGDRLIRALALKAPMGGLSTYAKWLALLLAAVGLFTWISATVFDHDQTSDIRGMGEIFRGPWWPLALIVIGVGAPLSEELLFRGFLQTALVQTRLGFWGGSAITTTLWTAMHAGYSLVGLIEVFLIGLVFCVMLRQTGSLRVTIASHAIYNTLIALIVILAPKDWLGF